MIKAKTVDEYIRKSNPALQGLARQLRTVLLSALPDIQEEIKWNMPCYSARGKNICYFCITKDHVGLGFYEGKYLTDKDRLLEGEGKTVRQANFKTSKDLQKKVITDWIREAVLLD